MYFAIFPRIPNKARHSIARKITVFQQWSDLCCYYSVSFVTKNMYFFWSFLIFDIFFYFLRAMEINNRQWMKFCNIIFMLQLSVNYCCEFLEALIKTKMIFSFFIYGLWLKCCISFTATECSYSLKFPLHFQTARGDTISMPSFSLELNCWPYHI